MMCKTSNGVFPLTVLVGFFLANKLVKTKYQEIFKGFNIDPETTARLAYCTVHTVWMY